jgi:PPM family protein phosphatase
MRCGQQAEPADKFCEGCGSVLAGLHQISVPRDVPNRDEAHLDGIVIITDRGLVHRTNEDAAAAGVVICEAGRAIAVAVCDGVSSSSTPDAAAKAASAAGVDAMLNALAMKPDSRAAARAGLTSAAIAAAAAGAETPRMDIAPSCTYAAAIVLPQAAEFEIAVGNVGDSRVYWLPDPPGEPRCLTVDDSVAQELMAAGAAPDSPAVQAGAHTITRWLGADAGSKPWSESATPFLRVSEPGRLLLCSDGLWNYIPDADDIAKICGELDAAAAATALVEYAMSAGGEDNITVAVIPVGGAS